MSRTKHAFLFVAVSEIPSFSYNIQLYYESSLSSIDAKITDLFGPWMLTTSTLTTRRCANEVCAGEDRSLSSTLDSRCKLLHITLEMADKNATGDSKCFEGTKEWPSFLQLASILRDRLDELISGTREAPGMRSIIEYAAPYLETPENAECSSSTSVVGSITRELKRRVVETESPCGHVCPQHPAMLDPAVWSRLPEELLELTFARLPLPNIQRLRCLSKQWDRSLNEKSHFKATCAEVNRKIFALLEENIDDYGKFWIKLYDMYSNRWHVYELILGDDTEPFKTMSAADGGLVVFASAWKATKKKPLEIVVVNPLTKAMKVLRLTGLKTHQLQMMQIVTNSITGYYKVILVSCLLRKGVIAEVFDSERDEWISLHWREEPHPSDQFFGIKYSWDLESYQDPDFPDEYFADLDYVGPCVYNYAEEKLNELNDESYPERQAMVVCTGALVKDRLFVLHEEKVRLEVSDGGDPGEPLTKYRYCITEYQAQIANPKWVRQRSINCDPFVVHPDGEKYQMRLYACKGLLLVIAFNDEWIKAGYDEVGWLYDLSAGEWRELPKICKSEDHQIQEFNNLMVELRWDADP